ncbi:MAG: terminase [Mycobacterium sp.]
MPNTPDTETPSGLHWSGRRLWEATVGEYELTEHETGLLLQACRTVDALDALQARLDADGPMVESPQGLRAHPALPELRQQRVALARLVAALGLPTGVVDEGPKRQRRSARGVYNITTGGRA